ncbi:MAG: oxaloacetate-decarboxylating malate dehydrogenase, partial [Tatlockia sp.]|nr:oxaloacetate-decarboxylating malate dehydrogenase [Tatlockia sp.]
RSNARRVLDKFQNELCTFNDDIQGTGAVTLAALLAACKITGINLEDNRIVVFGAGSAGTGICDQIVDALIRRGLSAEEAYKRFWLVDRQGLLIDSDLDLTEAQQPYSRKASEIDNWSIENQQLSLRDTVSQIKPTILIGCSAQTAAFSSEIVAIMAKGCERPIIFPLSNPDDKCEAQPADLLAWSQGKALIATGTAFPPVEYQNCLIQIAQCNNALVFPGIGLGILAVQATRLSKGMIWAAAEALSNYTPSKSESYVPLLPSLDDAQAVAKHIAVAVAKTAIQEKLAQQNQDADLEKLIHNKFWEPRYLEFKKTKVDC